MDTLLTKKFQMNRLKASLSDPDGWTIHADLSTLEHSSGLRLTLDHNARTHRAELRLKHVSLWWVSTQEAMGYTQHQVEDSTVVCSFDMEQLRLLRKAMKVSEHPSHIPPDVIEFFEADPNSGVVAYETEIAAALYVWQSTLRLQFLSVGHDAYQVAQAVLMRHLLPIANMSEVGGCWSIYADGTLITPKGESLSKILTPVQLQELYRPILNLGHPCMSFSDRDSENVSEFYVDDGLHMSIPASAHDRAALLHQK